VDVRSLVTQRFSLEDPRDYFGRGASNVMQRLKNIKLENRSND
jgi:hypothetical protein